MVDWLLTGFWLYVGFRLAALAAVVLSFAAVLVAVLASAATAALRQARCGHLVYRENQACDAICTRCGKNLGFIGAVRRDPGRVEQ